MLQSEGIKKIDEIKTNFTHRWFEVDYVLKVIDIFKFSSLLKSFSHFKKQGYGFKEVLSILLILPFVGISNINLMREKSFKAKKDVFYRLKNNPLIDWRSILWLFVMRFVNIVKANASDTEHVKCLIIDDSFLEKTGRFIEKISRMWDHVSKRHLLGFKLNVMGFWDGFSFIPIDFAFHREKGKNKKKWKTFLTTNTNLSFIRMLEIYAIRWSIEVFFKESKQLLSLGKEQANDFDSQIASTTLVMMQYILISIRYRFDNYESKGGLFKQAKVEIFRLSLSDRLWGLLLEILNMVIEIFENEDADELIEKMFNDEKLYQKIENFLDYSKMAA